MSPLTRSAILPLLVALSLAACDHGGPAKPGDPAPSARASAAAVPTTTAQAVASAAVAKMVDGARFKPFFPATGLDGATDKVEQPSKEGLQEIAYKKGKDDVAVMIISDTAGEPRVKDDYVGARDAVSGYPLKTSGYAKTAILVADRYQVQITSQRLKADARKAWLEKVDLKGLSALK
ncbi:MAG: hypothetical protein ABJE95_38345 [Byssovorax sp.]